jgi:hypothetical protein
MQLEALLRFGLELERHHEAGHGGDIGVHERAPERVRPARIDQHIVVGEEDELGARGVDAARASPAEAGPGLADVRDVRARARARAVRSSLGALSTTRTSTSGARDARRRAMQARRSSWTIARADDDGRWQERRRTARGDRRERVSEAGGGEGRADGTGPPPRRGPRRTDGRRAPARGPARAVCRATGGDERLLVRAELEDVAALVREVDVEHFRRHGETQHGVAADALQLRAHEPHGNAAWPASD